MSKHFLLIMAVFGGMFIAAGTEFTTNQWMIGNEVAHTQMVNGKLMLEALVPAGSNKLFLISTEIKILPEAPGASNADSSPKRIREPVLHLMLYTGDDETDFGKVGGYYGDMYAARDWRTPSLPQTNHVEILSTEDNRRIVVMVGDNGPIYSSTNSGMTWHVITNPGKYKFLLTLGPKRGGYVAEATIHPSPANQTATNPPASNWYAVGSASDGSKLVINEDPSQPAPVLSITHSDGGVVISWPAEFTGYVLQENTDFSSTNWVDVTDPVKKVGEENQVLISSPASNNFYRLRSH